MELRLREHLTGAEGFFRIPRDADEQHLCLSEVGKAVLMQDGAAMSRGGRQEVVQEEMQREEEPREAEQEQSEDLEFAKAPSLAQEVFEIHLCQGPRLLVGVKVPQEGSPTTLLLHKSRKP